MRIGAAFVIALSVVATSSTYAVTKKQTKPVPAARATKAKPTPKPTQLDLLKGQWTACRPFTNESGEVLTKGGTLGLKDEYSQVAPLSFTQSIGRASDKDCKRVTEASRTTFDCDELTPELLTCKTMKREERKGSGKWKSTALTDHSGKENSYTIKLAIVQKTPDTVSLTITSDESEESETFDLTKASK